MRARGIDVSAWQGAIDWDKVGFAGIDFAFIKSTEGNGHAQNYKPYWDGAGKIGLLRACYHFHRPVVPGAVQADYFLAHYTPGELPPVIDFEDRDILKTMKAEAVVENLKACLQRVKNVTKTVPIVYTGKWYLDLLSPVDLRWLAEYQLWIAAYPNLPDPENGQPLRPAWWNWRFWQYSSSGQISGINTRVDLNVYNGTREELRRWAGMTETPEPTDAEKLAILWRDYKERNQLSRTQGEK